MIFFGIGTSTVSLRGMGRLIERLLISSKSNITQRNKSTAALGLAARAHFHRRGVQQSTLLRPVPVVPPRADPFDLEQQLATAEVSVQIQNARVFSELSPQGILDQ